MEELLRAYEEHLRMKDYKPRGIEDKLRVARQFLAYVDDYDLDLSVLGLKEAEDYREALGLLMDEEGKPRYQAATINVMITNLRLFYSYLVGVGKAPRNPFFDTERLKEEYRLPRNIVSSSEMGKLLGSITVNSRSDFLFKLVVELLYATGMRISEVEHLERDDLDLEEGCILIRDDKERQDRKVPLTEYSLALLKLYVENLYEEGDTKLFPHGRDRSLNHWVGDRLKKVMREQRLPAITCHGIRHSIATHLFRNGAGIRDVQEFLGHRRIKNTEVYTHVLTEDLKRALEANHPRETSAEVER